MRFIFVHLLMNNSHQLNSSRCTIFLLMSQLWVWH